MPQPVADRIRGVVADVFGVPSASLTDASSPDTIDGWDSLGHVNLVLALESEFAVSISPEDAIAMVSIGRIQQVLTEKQIQ
jgi:acyl carrier protein